MQEVKIENIRNIAMIGHGDAGKTTLAEGILFAANETQRFGSVDDGSTVSDYNQDEIDRKISINAALMHCEWNGYKINIIDTPGYMDFTGEVKGGLHAVELGLLVVNAVSGLEVGSEIVWGYCENKDIPRAILINKLNKEHADFKKILGTLKSSFSKNVIPVQIPISEGLAFESFADVINGISYKFSKDKSGNFTKEDVPDSVKAEVDSIRNELKEAVAESNDELLEKYLEEGDISEEEFNQGIRSAIATGAIFPLLCTAADTNLGTKPLLDFIAEYFPSPSDSKSIKGRNPKSGEEQEVPYDSAGKAVLQVFKTVSEPHVGELSFFKCLSGSIKPGLELMNTSREQVERIGQIYSMNGHIRNEVSQIQAGDIGGVVKLKNTHTGDTLCDKANPIILEEIDFPSPIIRMAIAPKSKGDEDKISTGLHTLHEEDPSFIVAVDNELKQIIISGQGELHLDIIVKRLKQKMGVEVLIEDPKIPYRETIRGTAKAQGKYKKQSGGKGQFGDTWIKLEPMKRGEGFQFVNKIFGGSIPTKFISAVEKGIVETMATGILCGCNVIDIKVTLYDGSYHAVDSSDMAFKIAGSMALKKAFVDAKPTLLEPVYEIEVVVPEEFMGDVMGDLSGRRGKIQGMEAEGHFQKIKALVPLAELYKYSTTLRSITSGRGMHRRKIHGYEEVPREVSDKIIREYKSEDQE